MKIIVAIDSLKGSLSSLEAGESIACGIKLANPQADVIVRPLADGGEGTVESLALGCGGTLHTISVTGPLGSPVDCTYGIIEETKTAIVEMAASSGITLISAAERNPLKTTTYGLGEVILDAISRGCRHFLVGIGGSATNDGGIGMLQALGFGMLNAQGENVSFGAEGLAELAAITTEHVHPELKNCHFRIACDVNNPLCGELGCSAVYGPQKGATPSMILTMDGWLKDYAELAKKTFPESDAEYPGAGAAGGLGFAFQTFLNGKLESGIKIILEVTRLRDYVKDADLVITGEGRLDAQTVMGKAPIGVAKIAKEFNLPVIAFSGCVTADATACNPAGIDAFFPILRTICTLDEALEPANARQNLIDTTEQVFRLIQTFNK